MILQPNLFLNYLEDLTATLKRLKPCTLRNYSLLVSYGIVLRRSPPNSFDSPNPDVLRSRVENFIKCDRPSRYLGAVLHLDSIFSFVQQTLFVYFVLKDSLPSCFTRTNGSPLLLPLRV